MVHKTVEEMVTSELTLIGILSTRSSKVGIRFKQVRIVDFLFLIIKRICSVNCT